MSIEKSMREQMASLCHDQWSNWMKYLFSKCVINNDGSATIPKMSYDHWIRQINTPYNQLSEPEQDSDRIEADKFIDLIFNNNDRYELAE